MTPKIRSKPHPNHPERRALHVLQTHHGIISRTAVMPQRSAKEKSFSSSCR